MSPELFPPDIAPPRLREHFLKLVVSLCERKESYDECMQAVRTSVKNRVQSNTTEANKNQVILTAHATMVDIRFALQKLDTPLQPNITDCEEGQEKDSHKSEQDNQDEAPSAPDKDGKGCSSLPVSVCDQAPALEEHDALTLKRAQNVDVPARAQRTRKRQTSRKPSMSNSHGLRRKLTLPS